MMMNEALRHAMALAEELNEIFEGQSEEYENLADYINNEALDWEYILNRDRHYTGVRILVGFGGPNIYISTKEAEVQVYWGTDKATYEISEGVAEELDIMFSFDI